MATKARKRIYLINRDFQLRYTFTAVGLGVITTALTALTIFYPLYVFEILRIPRFLPTPFLVGMAAALLINILLIGIFGVLITHRIAGPMFSLTRTLRKIEMGDFSGVVKLRSNDDLQYLARNINSALTALSDMTKSDIIYMNEIVKELRSIDSIPKHVVVKLEKYLLNLEQRIGSIKE